MQVNQYAMLLACVSKGHSQYCFVRLMEGMDVNGQCMVNDYDCPLLSLSSQIVTVAPSAVHTAVSVMHECTSTCLFDNSNTRQTLEREDIHTIHMHLSYTHDWTNTFYCLNIYCMNQ